MVYQLISAEPLEKELCLCVLFISCTIYTQVAIEVF